MGKDWVSYVKINGEGEFKPCPFVRLKDSYARSLKLTSDAPVGFASLTPFRLGCNRAIGAVSPVIKH